MKKFIALVLSLVMALSLCVPAWGATTHSVSTAAELIELLDSDSTGDVQNGDVIKLTGNVTFNTTDRINVTGSYYDGVCYTGGASFTIDLGGYTITSDAGALNDYLLNIANKTTATANTITIKNGTLTAVPGVYSALCVGSSAATEPTTVNTENLTINGVHPEGAVVKIRGGSTWNANAGTIVNSNGAYTALECSAATANINAGAKLNQTNSSADPSVGSAIGVSGGGVVNVNGAEIGSDRYGAFVYPTGGTLNVISGTVTAPIALYADEYTAGYYIADSVINVSGGTITGDVGFRGIDGGDPAISISGGTVDGDILANTGDDLTVSGGTFTADVSEYVAPGYVFANGSVVNNAGQFVGSSSALTSSKATYGATLDAALANKTETVEVKAALEASASLKSFQTYQVFVTKLADKTVSVLPNQYIVVPTDVNADVVVVDGSKIIFLAQVAGVTKYDDNAEAVKVAYNAKPACDDVYVASAADAGVYYLYKNAYYVECDAVSADKVFNVDGVAVAAKATNLVKTLAHTYAFDTKTVGTKTEVTKVYCTVCKDSFSFVVGDLADAVKAFGAGNYADTGLNDANGDDIFVRTASGLVYVPVTPDTDKVESAETFDAGIAMYVGMSVMAAAGSAVVLKKKD